MESRSSPKQKTKIRGFLKWRYAQLSSIYRWIFHEGKHPANGNPPLLRCSASCSFDSARDCFKKATCGTCERSCSVQHIHWIPSRFDVASEQLDLRISVYNFFTHFAVVGILCQGESRLSSIAFQGPDIDISSLQISFMSALLCTSHFQDC